MRLGPIVVAIFKTKYLISMWSAIAPLVSLLTYMAGWSFTDCTSTALIEGLQITTTAALGQHFHQFGIEVLP